MLLHYDDMLKIMLSLRLVLSFSYNKKDRKLLPKKKKIKIENGFDYQVSKLLEYKSFP